MDGKYGEFETLTVYDDLNYAASLGNLQMKRNDRRFNFVKGNILDGNFLRKSVKKNSTFVHFAAETHVDRSLKNPQLFVETNVLGTQKLLEIALELECSRFLYVSTDEVYGSKVIGHSKELDFLNPTSPYAASKAAAEMVVNSYNKNFGLNAVITRSCNNFGPNQDKEKFIPRCLAHIMKNLPIQIYGRGENIREWIYVEDNCDAINLVLKDGKNGEIYNIGTGELQSNLNVVLLLLELFDKPHHPIEFVPDRLGHDFRYSTDSSKLKNELGFKTKFNLLEGLNRYIHLLKSIN
jgi:dTDP-glucose 4,6-dehydratase